MAGPSAEALLRSFERLPLQEQQAVAVEILRRSVRQQVPLLDDEELVGIADQLFVTLDEREDAPA
jgi:hypothetical protein